MNRKAGAASAMALAWSCAAFAAPSGASNVDRASIAVEIAEQGFAAAEEKRLEAAAGGDLPAVLDLARFYMANDLWVEAHSRVRDISERPAQVIAAECDYRMGRYRAAAARLQDAAPEHPLLAISLARLGAFDRARESFAAIPARSATGAVRADFAVAKAETLIETGDLDAAAAVLSGASGAIPREATNFLAARVRAARGDNAAAISAFRRAASGDVNEWSMRARLALLDTEGDIDAMERLSLEWRGGAFERDLQLALGRRRLARDDFDRGFRALETIVNRYPNSSAALEAQSMIEAALPRLFDDATGLHPKEAARLFFENVEYAPPGGEGDKLIRDASAKLAALGLYRPAAQLLDHQVFKRLRGGDRARVAADLAELHLSANDPAAALRVIRSTRIAGLSADENARRRRIEARALALSGKSDNALALLSDAPADEDLKLRAEINWSRRAWPEAARDYASYFESRRILDGKSDRALAVRAATAFLLAGDRAGYRAFASSAAERLGGAAEASLIRSLGDVDQNEFLANVLQSYRAVYGGG